MDIKSAQEKEQYNQYKLSFSQIVTTNGPLKTANIPQYSMFFEAEDKAILYKDALNISKCILLASVGGVIINRQITKFDYIVKSKLPIRLGIRTLGFLLPNLFLLPYYSTIKGRFNGIWRKYDKRIENYIRTSEFNYLDPKGLVYKEIVKGAQSFEG